MGRKTAALAVIALAAAIRVWAMGTDATYTDDGWVEFNRLDGFDAVEIRTDARVTVRQGRDWDVRARGDRRDLEDLDVYVSGGTLVVRRQSWFTLGRMDNRLVVDVTLPRLSAVTVTSSADLHGEDRFESGDLSLSLTGSGSIEIQGISDSLDCRATGSGDLSYSGRSDTLRATVTGSGGMRLDVVANAADLSVTGAGDIHVTGSAGTLEAKATGSGTVDASDFPVSHAVARVTSSGDVLVNVSDSLDARVSGSGTVVYRGNPGDVETGVTGSGSIIRR